MRRVKYKTEPKKINQRWAVRELGEYGYDDINFFSTKKEALEYIRAEIKEWKEPYSFYTYELFKISSNFIEAWK
jgi:hypothetical protein